MSFDPSAPGTPIPVTIDRIASATYSLACPSTRQCTIVDGSDPAVTFNPRAPRRRISTSVDNPVGVLACPSVSECETLDSPGTDGREITFNPRTSRVRSRTAELFGMDNTGACPSVVQCTLVDGGGTEVTFNPLRPHKLQQFDINDGDVFFGFACPSRTECVGADSNGEVTFDPLRPRPSKTVRIAHGQSFGALACPLVTQCTAVDTTQHAETFDPVRPGRPRVARVERYVNSDDYFPALACPSATRCVGVDGATDQVAVGDPRRTRAWSVQPITTATSYGYVELQNIACPSTRECVAVDANGQVFIGTR